MAQGSKTGGRQQGTPNRRTAEMLAELVGTGQSPAEYLVALYRNEAADPKDRTQAAIAAAPYVHPRLAPVQQRVSLDLPDTATAEGVRDAISIVVQAVANGELAPAEGQSLVAVIESQRKAIETVDIIGRLEALEARADNRRR